MISNKIALASPELFLAATVGIFLSFFLLKILRRKKINKSAALLYSGSQSAQLILEGDPSTPLRAGHEKPEPGTRLIQIVLRVTALTLAALALSRPQKVTVEELEPIAGVDIMLAIDTSASMQAIDFDPLNRLQAAKELAANFISKRAGDRIGVVSFGGAAVLNCPLTLDHSAVQGFLKQVEIGITQAEGTAIGSGLMAAITYLRKVPSKSKLVILLTDGVNNAGSVDPITAAKLAQSLGIKVYTIGAGKRGGGIFVINDPIFGTRRVKAPEEEIDEETLTKVAQATGGQYFRATEMGELRRIFDEIDKMEKTEIEAPKQVRYEELYYIPLAGALLVLGFETLLAGTWLFTIP